MPLQSSFYAETERYVTTEELEVMFTYKAQTWRRWYRAGMLPRAIKPFRRVMVPLSEAEALMQVKKPAGASNE